MNRDIVYVNVDQLKHIEDFGRKRVDWLRKKILTEGEWTVPLKVEKDYLIDEKGILYYEGTPYTGVLVKYHDSEKTLLEFKKTYKDGKYEEYYQNGQRKKELPSRRYRNR